MKQIWQTLEQNHAETNARPIISLFDKGDRLAHFSAAADGLYLDLSRTNIDDTALGALLTLARRGKSPRNQALRAQTKPVRRPMGPSQAAARP